MADVNIRVTINNTTLPSIFIKSFNIKTLKRSIYTEMIKSIIPYYF